MVVDSRVNVVDEIVDQMHDLLAGKGREVQGAVIADILARWLAGHIHPDGSDATPFRELLLTDLMDAVRKLIPLHEEDILERHQRGKH